MEPVRSHGTSTAYRRQKQIEDCLYANLLQTPYQSVSISDICRQVGISRKAFYNYFQDKSTCLRSFIRRLMRDSLIHVTKSVPDNASLLEVAISILDYWKAHRDFFDIIVRDNLLNDLLLCTVDHIMQEDQTTLDLLSTPFVQSDKDILACYMASQITLVLQWQSRNFETPTEEMAKKLLRILHSPLLTLPSSDENISAAD